jgi:type I restriction enzyme S subunit
MNSNVRDISKVLKKIGTEMGTEPWRTVRLGDYCSVVSGYGFKSKDFCDDGIFVVKIGNLQNGKVVLDDRTNSFPPNKIIDQIRKYTLKENDVLIALTGATTIGKIAVVSPEFNGSLLNQQVGRFTVLDENLHQQFARFYFNLDAFQQAIKENILQSVQGNVSPKQIENIHIPLPPLFEQKAIVRVLSTIQKNIEVQNKIIAASRGLKKSLTLHLFTYGPVPFAEAEKVPLKETEIGPMPKKWDVVKIKDIAHFQGGYAFKSGDYTKEGVKLLKITNVSFGNTVWNDVSFLPNEFKEKYEDYSLNQGEIIMAMTRPIVAGGIKIARLKEKDYPSLLNQRVGRFRIKHNINVEFLFQILFNKTFVDAIGLGASGSQQPNISANQIESIIIPLPSLSEQQKIASMISSIDKKIEAEENRNAALQTLFKTMLCNLMTGKVRIKELETQMP